MHPMPVILGPTACGKTAVAARLAFEMNGEVISADSRQVYRGMDIGSGKDLGDYIIEGHQIPYHLVDIAEPGYEYNIFEYQRDFAKAYDDIIKRGKLPILCGGSGMYLEAVLKGYSLPEALSVPGFALRMSSLDDAGLLKKLSRLKKLHSTTDTIDRTRMLRALEIEIRRRDTEPSDAGCRMQYEQNPESNLPHHASARSTRIPHPASSILFGLNPGRETIRQRITSRLESRLAGGMIEEVSRLLDQGVPPARLKAYGLEYKFLALYLESELSYNEMFRLLNTAIHQFAKRQMTWFRRMERQGMKIHWIEGEMPSANKVKKIRKILENGSN